MEEQRPPRNRMKDFWQLDVPLAIVLIVCTTFTVIEVSRATEGVWRAWVYSVEWPMIGIFCIWMWHRFRTENNPVKGVTRKWRERIEQYEAEADLQEADPGLAAWRTYVGDLEQKQAEDDQRPR